MPEPSALADRSVLLDLIAKAYRKYETMDLRVGTVWLHPDHIPTLKASVDVFDSVCSGLVRAALSDRGGVYEGLLFGAYVFSSEEVPRSHIGIVPDGFKAELVGGEGCIPLGLGS